MEKVIGFFKKKAVKRTIAIEGLTLIAVACGVFAIFVALSSYRDSVNYSVLLVMLAFPVRYTLYFIIWAVGVLRT